MELAKLMDQLALRMRLLKAGQESGNEDLSDRDLLLLEFLLDHGKMTISDISALCAHVSDSTVSTNITKLWRKKYVTKNINPDNQRVTFVELTAKGAETVTKFKSLRTERFAKFIEAMGFSDEERHVIERGFARALAFYDKNAAETK